MVDYITIFYGLDAVLVIVFVIILYFAYRAYKQRTGKQSPKNAEGRAKQITARPAPPALGTGSIKPPADTENKSAGLYLEELMERKSPPPMEHLPTPEPTVTPVYITDIVRQQPQDAAAKQPVEIAEHHNEVQANNAGKPAESAAPEAAPVKPDAEKRCCENCDYYQPLENLENMGTCKNFTCKKFNKTVQAPNLSCERYGDSFVQRFDVPSSDKYVREDVLRYLTLLRESGYKIRIDYPNNRVLYGKDDPGKAHIDMSKILPNTQPEEIG